MQKIRVVVANRPRLMRELILATISEQSDIEVVGEADEESDIADLVERTRPDFLITDLKDRGSRPGLCGFLLARYPEMRILAVAAERDRSIFYWALVDIHSKTVETSEEGILGALRVSSAC